MKCGSCFRCVEDWKDAKAKGLKGQYRKFLYSVKPRQGVKVRCTDVCVKREITPNSKACKNWEHRVLWNAKLWFEDFMSVAKRRIRVPLGRLRKPVPLLWVDTYNGMEDKIIHNGAPECPHCGEMPYSTKRCVFCGQRFIQDEAIAEYNKPPEKVMMNCPMCGSEKLLSEQSQKLTDIFTGNVESAGQS